MNYDSWKLASGVDLRTEELADRCADFEAFVDRKLGQAMSQVNRTSESQWEVEPALAEADDDGAIFLELNLRLKRVPVSGDTGDLQELVQAVAKLAETLASVARSHQTPQGFKLAPSVQNRATGQRAELG